MIDYDIDEYINTILQYIPSDKIKIGKTLRTPIDYDVLV